LFKIVGKYELVLKNPRQDFKKHTNAPREQIWTKNELKIFRLVCSHEPRLFYRPKALGILSLKWGDLQDGFWILTQSKTGTKCQTPILNELKHALAQTKIGYLARDLRTCDLKAGSELSLSLETYATTAILALRWRVVPLLK
jgi:hypothetical protein